MLANPLQFAVVREDPEVECALVARFGCRRVRLVASGGCTALTLAGRFPELDLTAYDPNPAQIAHLREKLANRDPRAHNVGDDAPSGLSARGNFETLWRGFRDFLRAFVATREEIDAVCAGGDPGDLVAHPYWPAAFDTFFNDGLQRAMFGPKATQYARRGSYPGYFRAALERGLGRSDRAANPFLHHILLGAYRMDAPPPHLRAAPVAPIRLVVGPLEDPGDADLLHLSNILDWMDPPDVVRLGARLSAGLRPGAVLTWRQLNNERELAPLFPGIEFDDALGNALCAEDRSLFYSRIRVGVRR